jgi:hypothetical protein
MKSPTDHPPRKQTARAARDQRLARALRENLRRRKEQARAIAGAAGDRGRASILSGTALSSTSDGDDETTAE